MIRVGDICRVRTLDGCWVAMERCTSPNDVPHWRIRSRRMSDGREIERTVAEHAILTSLTPLPLEVGAVIRVNGFHQGPCAIVRIDEIRRVVRITSRVTTPVRDSAGILHDAEADIPLAQVVLRNDPRAWFSL